MAPDSIQNESLLSGKRIVLGVTGGVAAYKAAELARLLGKAGVTVHAVLTEGAKHFVTEQLFQALTNQPVYSALWDSPSGHGMAHIDLSRQADAIVIAPATADTIARLVQGRADDLLTTLCLARNCPLIVCPAMNQQMWQHPATQRNVAQLIADGAVVLGPDTGAQACGEVGPGRMLEPTVLLDLIEGFFAPKLLQGKRVTLTAGPTFEAIDAVRGLTNQSSGKMGFALARAARDAGATVTLIAGPTAQSTPYGVEQIDVLTAEQMLAAVQVQVAKTDIFIGVAAVADYRPKQVNEHKIKRSGQALTTEFVENPDILASVSMLPKPPFCVGFAAESQDLLAQAEAKRKRKKLPLLAANLVQTAFDAADNALVLLDDAGEHPLPRTSKLDQARRLIAHIATLLPK